MHSLVLDTDSPKRGAFTILRDPDTGEQFKVSDMLVLALAESLAPPREHVQNVDLEIVVQTADQPSRIAKLVMDELSKLIPNPRQNPQA